MAKMKHWIVTYEYKVTRSVQVDADTRLNAVRAAEDWVGEHTVKEVGFAMGKHDGESEYGVFKIRNIRVAHVEKDGDAE